jgi:hypothetical protein
MTEPEANALVQALHGRFGGDVESEAIGNGRFRFSIVSPSFAEVPHMQRQDLVWSLVDQTVDRERSLDISLILTFAPAELEAAGSL